MTQKKLPKIISQSEFEQIFAEAKKIEDKTKSKFHKRNYRQYRIAMLLGFEAGLRISEIVGYEDKVPKLSKSNIDGKFIRLHSAKGGKDRVVSRPKRFSEKAVKELPLKIGRRSLQDFITKLGLKVLKKRISFHTLRHGFATHYYNKTLDLVGLQQQLGHSRLDTVGIYTKTNPEKTVDKVREVF